MGIRAFVVEDIPEVAELWWKFLRHGKGPAPPRLLTYFRELYFENPFVDSAIPPLVYELKGGRVAGFLGVMRRKMRFRGQPIRVAFGGHFVVHPEERSPLVALGLLQTYMAGKQDLSQTDSANDLSRNLLERLCFRTIVPLSIHWARPLQPFHYALHGMVSAARPALSAGIKIAASPICSAMDSMAARISFNPFRQTQSLLHGEELDVETLVQCLKEFRGDCSLWSDYDCSSLKWLLAFMERMHPRADLRKVTLRDEDQKIVGCYLYYLKPSGIGQVVQVGGQRKLMKDILDHLFFDAWSRGAIALHGVVPTQLMADFSDKNCFFTCRGGWTVAHSRNPELLQSLERGDVCVSRLDGEWCLNFDD